jgi:hypothetical protein
MSIASKLESIIASRNTIRSKLVELGLASATDKLATLATKLSNIVKHTPTEHVLDVSEQGNVEFVIEEGYHDGTGTVIIDPQSKTASAWYEPVIVTPDAGRVLDKVTVEAIPISYQDISMNVNVAPENLLEGVTVVGEQGALIDGAIPRNGAMNKTINGLTTTSVTIPAGYTTGGTVSLTSDIEAQLAAI